MNFLLGWILWCWISALACSLVIAMNKGNHWAVRSFGIVAIVAIGSLFANVMSWFVQL